MSEGPERTPAEERAERLEAALAAVTARVFQLEKEVAALRGQSMPAVSAPAVPQAAVAVPSQETQPPAAATVTREPRVSRLIHACF